MSENKSVEEEIKELKKAVETLLKLEQQRLEKELEQQKQKEQERLERERLKEELKQVHLGELVIYAIKKDLIPRYGQEPPNE